MTNATKISVTLDSETAKELCDVAAELGEKKSAIIQKALNYYFDKLDEKIADKRLDNLEVGNVQTISAKEAYKRLGI